MNRIRRIIEWYDEPRRAWTYRALTAAGGVALFYGLATTDEIEVWSVLAANVLGTGLASAKTSTKRS